MGHFFQSNKGRRVLAGTRSGPAHTGCCATQDSSILSITWSIYNLETHIIAKSHLNIVGQMI
jgi:hypothetical protein